MSELEMYLAAVRALRRDLEREVEELEREAERMRARAREVWRVERVLEAVVERGPSLVNLASGAAIVREAAMKTGIDLLRRVERVIVDLVAGGGGTG